MVEIGRTRVRRLALRLAIAVLKGLGECLDLSGPIADLPAIHAECPVGHGEPRVERHGLLQVGNRLREISLMVTGRTAALYCRSAGSEAVVTRSSGGSRLHRPQRLADACPQVSRQLVDGGDQPGGVQCRHTMRGQHLPVLRRDDLSRQHVLRAGSGDLTGHDRLDAFPHGDLAGERGSSLAVSGRSMRASTSAT